MEKLAVSRAAAKVIDLDAPIAENLDRIARARDTRMRDLTVTVLDRPRHGEIIDQVRAAGARIQLITDGDVAAAIHAAMEDYLETDVYIGIGGAPEAVLAAAALKCVGGQMLCRIWPRTDLEREKLVGDGVDLQRIYSRGRPGDGQQCLVRGDGHHQRRPAARRALRRDGRADTFGDDARAQRHDPLRRGHSQLEEAVAFPRRRAGARR